MRLGYRDGKTQSLSSSSTQISWVLLFLFPCASCQNGGHRGGPACRVLFQLMDERLDVTFARVLNDQILQLEREEVLEGQISDGRRDRFHQTARWKSGRRT